MTHQTTSQMTNILAIDCAFSQLQLGLLHGDKVHCRELGEVRDHSRHLLDQIDRLLSDAKVSPEQLSAIAFGQGPGSFTGLRIAVGVVQGLAYGLEIPVIPIPSMGVIATRVFRDYSAEHVTVALHARADEVYLARFQRGDNFLPVQVGPYEVGCVTDFAIPTQHCEILAGGGANTFAEFAPGYFSAFDQTLISAQSNIGDLIELAKVEFAAGQWVDPMVASPIYVREEVAKKPLL